MVLLHLKNCRVLTALAIRSFLQIFLPLLFPTSVQTKFEDGTDMVVTVISAMGEEAVIAVKNMAG